MATLSMPRASTGSGAPSTGRWRGPRRVAHRRTLLHVPAVADDEALAGEGGGRELGEEAHRARDVLHRREDAIDGVSQHHAADDFFLADAQFLRLFGNLLVDQRRAHETGTHHVAADTVP